MNLRIFDFRNEEDIRNILVTPQIRSRFLRLKAGSEMNDFHSHDLGHEIFLILQGRCRFEIDGEQAVLGTGQMCIALANQPHRVNAVGEEDVIMYLSVTPHIVPTHTSRTPKGKRQPHSFWPPKHYDAVEVTKGSNEELTNRMSELAQSASRSLLKCAEKTENLKQILATVAKGNVCDTREKVWKDLIATFQDIYALGEVWNELAPRLDGED